MKYVSKLEKKCQVQATNIKFLQKNYEKNRIWSHDTEFGQTWLIVWAWVSYTVHIDILVSTVLAIQMCTLLYLPPFFLPFLLSSNDRKQKSVIDKEQTSKYVWKKFSLFWVTKMGTLKTLRAFMYLENSVLVKEKGRERQKKKRFRYRKSSWLPKKARILWAGLACVYTYTWWVSGAIFTLRKLRKWRWYIASILPAHSTICGRLRRHLFEL